MIKFLRYSSISGHYCLELYTQCNDAEVACQMRNGNDLSRIFDDCVCACSKVYSNSYLEEVGKAIYILCRRSRNIHSVPGIWPLTLSIL